MNVLEKLFATKTTENGDKSYNTTGNNLLDILFMSEYFQYHLNEINLGTTEKEKLFAMFIRDPRSGLGRRDLGRRLMRLAEVEEYNVVKAGRFDDLLFRGSDEGLAFWRAEVLMGNHLAKKWCPRLTGKHKEIAKELCKAWRMTQKEYRHFIKTTTTESRLTNREVDDIDFSQVPSLAMIKYFGRFTRGEDTAERFKQYLSDVEEGKQELKVTTTNVYDIYKNRDVLNADLFFSKLEQISINCLVILDSSGSMYYDDNDAIGKALSIGHYLTKYSTYHPGYFISFSRDPKLLQLQGMDYNTQLKSMHTGEVANTDFGKVMKLLEDLEDLPEYLVVLSDMEFDAGSNQSKEALQALWKQKGYTTKIIWWNFNSRNTTVPELDEMGNIYLSGYSPMLLKYLEAGFDGAEFLDKLLDEYSKKVFK